jgi:hypothetical protein
MVGSRLLMVRIVGVGVAGGGEVAEGDGVAVAVGVVVGVLVSVGLVAAVGVAVGVVSGSASETTAVGLAVLTVADGPPLG